MKKLFLWITLVCLVVVIVATSVAFIIPQVNATACTYVHDYYRKDGTFVHGYYRGDCSNKTSPTTQILIPQTTQTVTQPGLKTTPNTPCVINGALEDKTCTPGAAFPGIIKETICVSGYTQKVRNVTTATKNKVFKEYGITRHTGSTYEVDHLIPLELGGSNDITNLWPEAASPVPGFHQKDLVENYLHKQVCSGAMNLQDAQKAIVNDWTLVYQKIAK